MTPVKPREDDTAKCSKTLTTTGISAWGGFTNAKILKKRRTWVRSQISGKYLDGVIENQDKVKKKKLRGKTDMALGPKCMTNAHNGMLRQKK